MSRSPSNIDWDTAILNLRIGSGNALFRLDAGILREKSKFFAAILAADDWNESVVLWCHSMKPPEFKIYKDWLYGRQPRWFEHYMHGSREDAAEEANWEDQWPVIPGVQVNAWKSRYCYHLCLLWLHGKILGVEFQLEVMNRLTKITLIDPGKAKKVITTDEPDWTDTFVVAPSTLRLIYSSPVEGHSPLHLWAVEVIASRLDTEQLYEFSKNELLAGFMNDVYQTKLWLTDLTHKEELQNLRRELGASCSPRTNSRRAHRTSRIPT